MLFPELEKRHRNDPVLLGFSSIFLGNNFPITFFENFLETTICGATVLSAPNVMGYLDEYQNVQMLPKREKRRVPAE